MKEDFDRPRAVTVEVTLEISDGLIPLIPDMPDGSIFAGGVHAMKYQKQCIAIGSIVQAL